MGRTQKFLVRYMQYVPVKSSNIYHKINPPLQTVIKERTIQTYSWQRAEWLCLYRYKAQEVISIAKRKDGVLCAIQRGRK